MLDNNNILHNNNNNDHNNHNNNRCQRCPTRGQTYVRSFRRVRGFGVRGPIPFIGLVKCVWYYYWYHYWDYYYYYQWYYYYMGILYNGYLHHLYYYYYCVFIDTAWQYICRYNIYYLDLLYCTLYLGYYAYRQGLAARVQRLEARA